MEELVEINVTLPKQINREYLREMSRSMVRKDFELIRIQDRLLELFKDAEFFSHSNDELLSIQHSFELASGDILEKYTENTFWGIVSDAGTSVAFDYKRNGVSQVENINEFSEKLVDIIFDSCKHEGQIKKERSFIEGFEKEFPYLSFPFMEDLKMKTDYGTKKSNNIKGVHCE